jgi:hypothetical protein
LEATEFHGQASIDNAFGFDVPIGRRLLGYDMNITGITLQRNSLIRTLMLGPAATAISLVAPYFQVDGAGPWQALGSATPANAADGPTTRLVLNFGPVLMKHFTVTILM